ncbi:MAG: mersacidin/lichenicidin family type 2 lantibiotic [Richelia sp. SL_2_1]|nr:mersacidin/lichenicidin family type 2 lantibiotic [Richelia sp. RM1_1_1]NJO28397.1 mersacidin/lichenicidin family type 2 lantibiotic [Richelia sp. SL_2_1]
MSNLDIVRAWKDEEYRASLSPEQKAQLPENPAGLIELTNDDMSSLGGGLVADPTHTKTCKHCCPKNYETSIDLAS